MSRPEAPLIPATVELLWDWTGPVVEMLDAANDDWQLAAWDPAMGESSVHGFSLDDDWQSLLLDLRRPEVQDRVSRVWWGASGVVAVANGCHLELRGRCVATFHETTAQAYSATHVPALAAMSNALPDTDVLAWALWHYWEVAHGR